VVVDYANGLLLLGGMLGLLVWDGYSYGYYCYGYGYCCYGC
jgi:hypothetical protein